MWASVLVIRVKRSGLWLGLSTYLEWLALMLGWVSIAGDWGPVHTNLFSNKNGAVLLRIRLLYTLQRRKWSLKMDSFKNTLQSGAIWIRCFLKTLFSSVDGENDAIWKWWRHPSRHNRAPAHSTVSIENGEQTVPCGFPLDDRCSVDGQKR